MKARTGRARRVKPERESEPERLIPVSELKREAERLVREGKMPTLAELLRAMREVKHEMTIPLTKAVQ